MTLSETKILEAIETNKGLLFKVAHQYCHDTSDREDLIQEMIIAIWKSASRYNADYKLSTWMTKIAINIAVSHYRKNKKHRYASDTLDEHTAIIAPENSIESSEQSHFLHQILKQETPLNRALIILYLEGYSQQETAEILGVSTTNVASKLHRLKTKFARQHTA